MSSKNSELSEVTEISELEEVTQPQAQGEDIVNNAQSESIISKELHAASSSHLKFPDGELVDEELLGSNPPDADKNLGGQQLGSSMEEISSPGSCESFVEPKKKRVKKKHVKLEDNENRTTPNTVAWFRIRGLDDWRVYVDGVPMTEAERLRWDQIWAAAREERRRLA